MILRFNGKLVCNGDVIEDCGVVDIAYEAYITADKCYNFCSNWSSVTRVTQDPFLGVVAADGPVFAYSKRLVYVINKETTEAKTVQTQSDIKKAVVIQDCTLLVLCEDNCVYEVVADNPMSDEPDWILQPFSTNVLELMTPS